MYASKSRSDFPGEEIWLDSLLALLFEEPCPLVAHTDFSAYIPSLGSKEIGGVRWLLCGAKPVLEGEEQSSLPQRADTANDRADEC